MTLPADVSVEAALRVLGPFSLEEPRLADRTLTAPIAGGAATLTQALRAFDAENVTLRDVGLRRPTLDDVFLTLTGRVTETRPEPSTGSHPDDSTRLLQEVA